MTTDHIQSKAKRKVKGFGSVSVYETLRDEILSLTLEPSQLIDEASLARRFGVSRSPIREALVRLTAESLLQTFPNKGTIVAPLRIEEFPHYIDALDLIQRAVTRLAAEFRAPSDLEHILEQQNKFVQCVDEGNVMGMILCNQDFHIAIAKAAKNRYLEKMYQQLLDNGRRSLRLYYKSYGDLLPKALLNDHFHIIDAIEAKDVELAERLAHEHTEELHHRFLNYLGARRMKDFSVSLCS